MDFPAAFLDELRERVSLHDIVGRRVRWDQAKSKPAQNDWWGCCPFHAEKTPSFHVDEKKGFYHCFGCGVSGNAISFVMELEKMRFPEAVEYLAAQAGMSLPRRDPAAKQRDDQRTKLLGVVAKAEEWFRHQLTQPSARHVRDYLNKRGVSDTLIERFSIGHAPRAGLIKHLQGEGGGVSMELMITAGLAAKPDDGGDPYERFRDRIIFPITDHRGRTIAFGGRSLNPEARAKYLNSPETPLFHKGNILFNLPAARTAAHESGSVIVTEGYMDVIALARAGIDNVVAPLGTAISARQIELLWQIAPEPVICLDGDDAGLAAARRVMDLALPMLKSGHSLRFALMPAGCDPDDVVTAEGPDAVRRLLEAAVPMSEMLWEREIQSTPRDTPEQRAAVAQKLRQAVKTIADRRVREHYAAFIRERLDRLFAPASPPTDSSGAWRGGKTDRRMRPGAGASAGAATSRFRENVSPELSRLMRGRSDAADAGHKRRALLLLALALRFPSLAAENSEELADFDIADPRLAALRDSLLAVVAEGVDAAEALAQALEKNGFTDALETLHSTGIEALEGLTRSDFDSGTAAELWRHAVSRDASERQLPAEISEVADGYAQAESEAESINRADRLRSIHTRRDSPEGNETHFNPREGRQGRV